VWLVIHGGADDVVPVEEAKQLAGANPKAELRIHATAGHRFDQPDERGWLVESVESTQHVEATRARCLASFSPRKGAWHPLPSRLR